MIDLPPELPTIPSEPVIEGLKKCGIEQESISIKPGVIPDAKQVTISGGTLVPEKMFECIWRASWTHELLFTNRKLEAEYSEFTSDKLDKWQRGMAKKELEESGYWQDLPRIENYPKQSEFIDALSHHCSHNANSILVEDSPGVWTFRKEAVENAVLNEDGQLQFLCVLQGLRVQNVTNLDNSIRFGIAANGPNFEEKEQ